MNSFVRRLALVLAFVSVMVAAGAAASTYITKEPSVVRLLTSYEVNWTGFSAYTYVHVAITCPGAGIDKHVKLQSPGKATVTVTDFVTPPKMGCYVNTTAAYLDENDIYQLYEFSAQSGTFSVLQQA